MYKNKKLINLVVFVVTLLVIALGAYIIRVKYMQKASVENNPQEQIAKVEQQKKIVLTKVKSLITVPEEEPKFFTVSDASLIKTQQDFFENTENGDVLLVFEVNKFAVLYRDSANQIINMGPIGSATSTNATTTKVDPKVKAKK